LNEAGVDDARNVADKIRGIIEENSIGYTEGGEKKRGDVTVSIGISELTGQSSRPGFIERAEKQMYMAKRAGKNKICP
jgi:PleD family two-component response regulator